MQAYKSSTEDFSVSSPAARFGKLKWWFVAPIVLGIFACLLPWPFRGAESLNLSGSPFAVSIAHAGQGTPQVTDESKKWTPLWYLLRILATLAGAFCVYLGYKLFVLGVSGQASLIVESKTTKGQLINASPGIFFALFGMALIAVVIWKT